MVGRRLARGKVPAPRRVRAAPAPPPDELPAEPARKRGRPPKLTDRVRESICEHVRKGLPVAVSAWLAGVSERSVANWKAQGEDDEEHDLETIFVHFLRSLKEAEAEFIQGRFDVVQTVADGFEVTGTDKDGHEKLYSVAPNWQAAMAQLERRFPHHFGRRTVDVNLSGGDSQRPVTIHVVTGVPRSGLERSRGKPPQGGPSEHGP